MLDHLVFFFVEMHYFPSFPCNGFMYARIIEGFSFDSEDEADHLYAPETPSVIKSSVLCFLLYIFGVKVIWFCSLN